MGNQVSRYRKLKGLTQQQVADLLGIHLTNYNKLENGKSAPDISRFEKLAEILEVSVSDLLAESLDQPSRALPETAEIDPEVLARAKRIKALPSDQQAMVDQFLQVLEKARRSGGQ